MLQLQVIAFTIIGLSQVALGAFDVTRPCSVSATQIREGDMTLLVSQPGFWHGARSGSKRERSMEQRLWPNATVPYTFGSGISENDKRLIWKAMRHWEDNTCLRFRPRTTEKDYINYYSDSDDECCSYVGRQGYGQQGVSLGRKCMKFYIVVHEIGHAIGFYHAQNRPDRNRFIRVLYENIRPDVKSQYDINNYMYGDSRGVGYDYNSIMHYNDDAGVRSGSQSESRSGRGLKTKESIPPPVLPFPDCGQILTARNGVISSPGYPTYRHNQRCGWIIALGKGYGLRIKIEVSVKQGVDCTKDSIEVFNGKSNTSPRLGRLCGSIGSYVFIILRGEALIQYRTDGFNNDHSTYKGFRLTYRSEDIDECVYNITNKCSHGCQNLFGSFKCTCRPGFRLSADGKTCFDIQECAIDNGGCDHTCTNAAGSYSCSCHPGYSLHPDGKSCRPSTFHCEIPPNQRGGSVICRCPGGFQLTSKNKITFCEDINECRDNTSNRCSHGCQNTIGSFQCTCPSGYWLLADQRTCVPSVVRQTLTSPTGTVALPANPSANYIWVIRLPDVSKAVKLTFQSRFRIQDWPPCASSYLEVRDGDDSNSMLVGRYCGSTAPPVITSSTNTLYIRSNASLNHIINVEFRATFKSVQLAQDKFVCGRVGYAPSQFGPADFSTIYNGERPRVCNMLIGTTTSRSMDFRVLYTDLPGNCSQAKIEVFNVFGATEKKKATICSAEDARNAIVRVNGVLMSVRYEVNIPSLRGFRASVTDTCDPGMIPPRSGTQCVRKQTV